MRYIASISSGPRPAARADASQVVIESRKSGERCGIRARQRPGNKGALARAGADQTFSLKVAIGLKDRVRVYRQLGNDLLSRRQLVAWLEESQLQGLMDLLDQLKISGDTGAGVKLELDHDHTFTNH